MYELCDIGCTQCNLFLFTRNVIIQILHYLHVGRHLLCYIVYTRYYHGDCPHFAGYKRRMIYKWSFDLYNFKTHFHGCYSYMGCLYPALLPLAFRVMAGIRYHKLRHNTLYQQFNGNSLPEIMKLVTMLYTNRAPAFSLVNAFLNPRQVLLSQVRGGGYKVPPPKSGIHVVSYALQLQQAVQTLETAYDYIYHRML